MEVDQGDAGGSMATGFQQFKHMLGTSNFDRRAPHRDQTPEGNQEGAQHGHSVPMDNSPTGPTLPTTMIATPKVLGPRQLPPTPPQPARQARNAEQSDAIAAQVEKLHRQREKEQEQYKAVIAQKEVDVPETKARWQIEAAQKTAEYQDHIKRIEKHFNQVPFNQVI